jgi:hypothetical protein
MRIRLIVVGSLIASVLNGWEEIQRSKHLPSSINLLTMLGSA